MRFILPFVPIAVVARIECRRVNWKRSFGLRTLMAAVAVAAIILTIISTSWLAPRRKDFLRFAAWYALMEDYQSRKVERWRRAQAKAEANLRAVAELTGHSGQNPGATISADHEHDLYIARNCPAWLAESTSQLDEYRGLKHKYTRAAHYPWISVSPEPPPPPEFKFP